MVYGGVVGVVLAVIRAAFSWPRDRLVSSTICKLFSDAFPFLIGWGAGMVVGGTVFYCMYRGRT